MIDDSWRIKHTMITSFPTRGRVCWPTSCRLSQGAQLVSVGSRASPANKQTAQGGNRPRWNPDTTFPTGPGTSHASSHQQYTGAEIFFRGLRCPQTAVVLCSWPLLRIRSMLSRTGARPGPEPSSRVPRPTLAWMVYLLAGDLLPTEQTALLAQSAGRLPTGESS